MNKETLEMLVEKINKAAEESKKREQLKWSHYMKASKKSNVHYKL